MGRAKLKLIYQENFCTRLRTYTTRMKGLKKKANELSVLCGVDVLMASFSPELNSLELWPEDTTEFNRIRERSLSFRMKKSCSCDHEGNGITEQQISLRMTPSSLSLSSFHEEKAAMEIKLQEVRERLEFLQRQRQEEAERLQAQYEASKALQQIQDLHRRQQSFSFPGCLPPHITADFEIPLQPELFPHKKLSPFAQFLPLHVQPELFPRHDFNNPLQQDFHPHEQASLFFHSLTPHEQPLLVPLFLPPHEQPLSISLSLSDQEQPSPLSKSTPPHPDADFNREDAPISLLPFDSPLWSNYECLSWCDSLLLDYETEL
ncbi:agamous-like MADS-box protein AGL80 [Dendrobium catenatum]|uniref:MADS-box transcription factor PHERES 1 n=1 Tax=Dendrobium catenatum TaxID=906689 RepID=A0A2I0WLX3_9ASPA|nr:agamous-like MADS-box protein AGL80 [Dendrobium catenatum]PKU76656.1 MADS-box transcription factor PHERES 1 [Dendrobium catenatum]